MLTMFRNFFKSKLGIVITLAFLGLIALAFASSDVANTSVFGGVSGGDRVAVVGDERIDAAELANAATNALDQARQTDPTITMQSFVARGGLQEVLDQLLQRTALGVFARSHGMRAGDRLVDSELLQIPAFRGADGNFDKEAFRAVLAQRGLTDAAVRQDIGMGMLARQLITPITFSPVMPDSVVRQYASLLRERRQGSIAMLPSAEFAPQGNPTDAQLQAFYREASSRFIRPERRVIRFASFGDEALGDLPAPTAAQIAQRYQRDRAQYAATERRRFTQLVAPTQDAARAIVAEIRAGKAMETAAREKGLATTSIGPVTRTEFATTASAAVAQAAFAAQEQTIATPSRGGLGWYILRVDQVERQAARTLEQVRGDIAAALAQEQRRAALADLTARIEEDLEEGRSLSEVAEELGVEITSTAPATADGGIYGQEGQTVSPILGRVLPVAFEMEEREPQLAELEAGQTFLIFDVGDITPSAAAPLAEIRSDVIALWRRTEGAEAAKDAADRIMARLARGTALPAAIAAERKAIPVPQTLNITRDELAQAERVPSSMALFFSMAKGTVKKLEAPAETGWYVVKLDDVEPGTVAANDPIIAATLRQLGQVTGQEYIEQFVKAAQAEIGTERNPTAIKAVEAQLTGNRAD